MRDKQVLITGGTGGLGVAVTRLALARGAFVTATRRVGSDLGPFGDFDDAARARLSLKLADVGDESQVRGVVDGMARVDVLLHLVGGFAMGASDEVTLEAWRAHIDLTLTTTFLCCKHALRRMKQAGHGRIVTIGSRALEFPMAETAAYSAAKAGVAALTRVIAEEAKGTDVTATCVMPSIIDTPANRAAMGDAAAGSWVTPASLAEVICFAGSAAAGDIRGGSLAVYGGV
jgi:NAD(P)-dependent dehydrogenase (short-subunit alcohol dehydrogenase family)